MSDKPIHMRFYDTSFVDYDFDHLGYADAFLTLSGVAGKERTAEARKFFAKYAAIDGHKHQALCKEALGKIVARAS